MSESFRVVGTKKLLQSHVFGVEQRTIEHDGTTFERDVVTHLGAVAILAINERDEIGMIRQYRTPFDRFCWEVPAGTLDVPGEDALSAAQARARRGTGLRSLAVDAPGTVHDLTRLVQSTDDDLRGPWTHDGGSSPAGPEETSAAVRWFSREELRETLRREPAIDNSTVVALGRVYGTFFDDV